MTPHLAVKNAERHDIDDDLWAHQIQEPPVHCQMRLYPLSKETIPMKLGPAFATCESCSEIRGTHNIIMSVSEQSRFVQKVQARTTAQTYLDSFISSEGPTWDISLLQRRPTFLETAIVWPVLLPDIVSCRMYVPSAFIPRGNFLGVINSHKSFFMLST